MPGGVTFRYWWFIGMLGVRPDQNAPVLVPFDPNQIRPVACVARQHSAGGGSDVKLPHMQVQVAYLGVRCRESRLASYVLHH